MAKRNKWISIALDFLNLAYDNDRAEQELNTIKDINSIISSQKEVIQFQEDRISDAQEIIEKCNLNIERLESIKNQAEIEEFRAMNPKAKAVYKF